MNITKLSNPGTIRTFIINCLISLNENIKIADGVTLIFNGGIINGKGTLTGDKTKLVAGPTQIFGKNLTVNGKWCIDRAYPQWFDSKVGTDTWRIPTGKTNSEGNPEITYNDYPHDCPVAINKAIMHRGLWCPQDTDYIADLDL